MDMELRILENQEQFRVLAMHKYTKIVDPEDIINVKEIDRQWKSLCDAADKKDFESEHFKKIYAVETTHKVEGFKEELRKAYE